MQRYKNKNMRNLTFSIAGPERELRASQAPSRSRSDVTADTSNATAAHFQRINSRPFLRCNVLPIILQHDCDVLLPCSRQTTNKLFTYFKHTPNSLYLFKISLSN